MEEREKVMCITCGAYILPKSNATKFPCPECGKIIVRCARCRELARKYTCECGFTGP